MDSLPKDSNKISILSLNCFGAPQSRNIAHRFKLLKDNLKKLQPNIILLQEVITDAQRKVLIESLSRHGYKYFYKTGARFRNGGLLTFSNLPTVDEGFRSYKIRASPFPLSITDRFLKKGFQVFSVRLFNKTVKVINTHVLTNYGGLDIEDYCVMQQIYQLLKYIKTIPKDMQVILGGDLNIREDTFLYEFLINTVGFYDPLEDAASITYDFNNSEVTSISKFFMRESTKIDYTLFRGFKESDISQRIVFSEPFDHKGTVMFLSDHFGVLTTIIE